MATAPKITPVSASLEVAALVIENGGTTLSGIRAFHATLSALGDGACDLFVRIDVLIVSRSGEVLGMRRLHDIGTHLMRAELALQLAEHRDLTLDELLVELRRIGQMPAPYSVAQSVLAVAVGSVAFAFLAGGDAGAAAIAAASGVLGRLSRHHLMERGFFVTFTTLLAALSGTLSAALALRLGLSASDGPALLGSIMHLVPGVILLNGVWDLTAGRHVVMGLQRLVFAAVLFLTLGLALAVGAFVARGW